ncbi:hypothetical protein SK066_18610 [Paenibacillus hunanensis]|uniref:hypothetical protein n=1 Tax=Paenibacillus hunanensis TaxID=539262 RepID=UPI002A6A76A1|nr:hypothetical protein [Paenibacillus hunanensis]WPP40586.1 hypothetical protein SK066_18610 [Paenibacillus hunanensis]
MMWHTLAQLLAVIQLGQKARTMDGMRIVIRTTAGLVWAEGRLQGQPVPLQEHLFSDLWTIFEDDDSLVWLAERQQHTERTLEMLENQYLEWRAERITE